ncbi:NAD(P)/FAD-dependent oxidoreductase [Salicibibacter halophilus]|uniref:NAD(P)/FAD-dependent oxidoreductase n=1 Tax=Salicibibacter halophilus TaxID=2502791 RepID=A0A514LIN3_9BACI|nr:nitrite reductase large subunit NirB [Salicibibacter halophilus]QDI91716.1 NAD(P)/FAD-dependent oxidoreductase [Salicibibacter halophilus]
MKERLVLIGNGMAGIRTLEELLKQDSERYEITVFGKEPHPNYNRIQLSSVLQGDTELHDIMLNDYDWYKDNKIELITGDAITHVDTERQTLYSAAGVERPYDRLIFATGSNPFMLPLPGADKEGVIAFRNIQDCETMINTSKSYKKAVVIGGGLLGLEAARGLLNLGMEVDVIHLADRLMENQLDGEASGMLKEELQAQGMNIHLKKQTEALIGADRVEGLQFKDGESLDADLVVMAVGIRPNIELAKETGIDVGKAILVNDYMETSHENIYAVGECAEHREVVYGLVTPLFEQAKVLASRLCKEDGASYEGSIVSTSLKVSGVDVFSAGEFMDTDETKSIRVHDEFEDTFKKVVVRDNYVVGSVLFGDTSDSPRILSMMRSSQDVSGMNKATILPSESAEDNAGSAVELMPDEENICGCNGVCKGEIVSAIKEQGLTTVEEVKKTTNASRSCGGCKPQVTELLSLATGEDASQAEEPICGCTDHSHEDVVAAIREMELTYIPEVMNVLGWETEDGCTKCRPALNYYLGMVNPLDYEDDENSRFINERMHANIQNDGTFSVVPRMYGGVTDSDQLRTIANVADKYDVPLLKVTGGQRIDLLGIEKENLPSVWDDLGMRSGNAYGKGMRTVKTCVGENFCRFGTQDSIGLGIKMEQKFEGMKTPHKVKMAVSACPRNCAESGIKDVGIVGVEGAWEIFVAGNAGVDLKKSERLCKVETDEEVLEITAAFLQHYRENARYLERTSHYIDRVGLDTVKKVVLEDEKEKAALNERMDIALSIEQDPWTDIVDSEDKQKDLFEKKQVSITT